MDAQNVGFDVFFLLLGAILVFAMHGGFAFLEMGTVRHKNQVNALVKILVDFAFSTIAYFFIGYWDRLRGDLLHERPRPVGRHRGVSAARLRAGALLLSPTFAAAVPAIISGGIAERAKFWPQVLAAAVIVGVDLSDHGGRRLEP